MEEWQLLLSGEKNHPDTCQRLQFKGFFSASLHLHTYENNSLYYTFLLIATFLESPGPIWHLLDGKI